MVNFAWKAFSSWQSRPKSDTPEGIQKRKEMYTFMKGFRETFSRPVRRIRFLGLFDTVNRVPRFEAAWMERSKFPYTAKTSARVIRHAVSIDERRAKFRQDLIYQSEQARMTENPDKEYHPAQAKLHRISEKYRRRQSTAPGQKTDNPGRRPTLAVPEDPSPYRARSRSSRTHQSRKTESSARNSTNHDARPEISLAPHPHHDDDGDDLPESEDENDKDIDEVWFSGGHGDIGGGWKTAPGTKPASHVPLAWMVREATRAGLGFDPDKVKELGCTDCDDETFSSLAAAPGVTWETTELGNPSSNGIHEYDNIDPRSILDITVRTPTSSTPKLFQSAALATTRKPPRPATTRRRRATKTPQLQASKKCSKPATAPASTTPSPSAAA